MKSFFSLIIAISASILTFAQEPIAKELQQLVFTQLFDLHENYSPLIVPTPGTLIYGVTGSIDPEVCFKVEKEKSSGKMNFDAVCTDELHSRLPLLFRNLSFPEQLRINSFFNGNLPVSISLHKQDKVIDIQTFNTDGSFRREAKYSNGNLVSLSVTNSSGTFLTSYEYSDTLIRKYLFTSGGKKYRIVDEVLKNGLPVGRITYKESRDRNRREVRQTERFTYLDGRLASVIRYAGNRAVIDSVHMIYDDSYSIEILFNGGIRRKITRVLDPNDALTEKRTEYPERSYLATYGYDDRYNITSILITDKNSSEQRKYSFSYSSGSKLAEIDEFRNYEASGNWSLEQKILFTYAPDAFPESITEVRSNGTISRKFNYSYTTQP